MAKAVAVIINYNGGQYVEKCVETLLAQTYEDLKILFIDNASPEKDGLDIMHRLYDENTRVTIVANTTNKGYAKAANQGIRVALSRDAEFVMIANPDLVFTPEYFSVLIEKLKEEKQIAAITGKIYKYDYKNDKPTDIIDSTGLFMYKNRRIIDNGQGLVDEGQFNEPIEIFGVSGACPIYRMKALEDVKIMDEYFDEDFFMYKEDVDLSWRFNLYGWKCFYEPKAVAYHGRGTGVARRFFSKEIFVNRKNLSAFQKKLALRNQFCMEIKNDFFVNRLRDFRYVMPRKLFLPFYMTFVEPYLWLGFFGFLKLLPRMLSKRSIIMKNKKLSAAQIHKWFKARPEYL